jgi:hypothetical protein
MSEFNIEIAGGSTVRLKTAGKYCDRDILVTAKGGSDPTYKVIPLGKYVFHPNSDADLELSIAEWYDEENEYYEPYPEWFTAYVESEEATMTGFGMYCTNEAPEVECTYDYSEWLNFYITDGTVVTVIREIEVPKEQYDAFMQYFTLES